MPPETDSTQTILVDQRIENVELKLMELDNTVAELNEVIIQQYQYIDALKATLQRLEGQIDNLDGGDKDPHAERPPHY